MKSWDLSWSFYFWTSSLHSWPFLLLYLCLWGDIHGSSLGFLEGVGLWGFGGFGSEGLCFLVFLRNDGLISGLIGCTHLLFYSVCMGNRVCMLDIGLDLLLTVSVFGLLQRVPFIFTSEALRWLLRFVLFLPSRYQGLCIQGFKDEFQSHSRSCPLLCVVLLHLRFLVFLLNVHVKTSILPITPDYSSQIPCFHSLRFNSSLNFPHYFKVTLQTIDSYLRLPLLHSLYWSIGWLAPMNVYP